MARRRSTSKGGKRKKKSIVAAPPPPPPTLIRVNTPDDLNTHVAQHQGAALLAVVSPICSASTTVIVPYLEKLNSERPPLLKDAKLLVLYAMDANEQLCEQLQVTTVPSFFSFSYGVQVGQFSGDSVEKVLLIAKIAGQKAQEETARLEAERKAAEKEAAAA